MREIKFRGKKTSTGEWVNGSLIIGSDGICVITQIIHNPVSNGVLHGWCFAVDSKTVGQFTGLKDKNGVEIYEKDKCLDKYGNEFIIEWDYKLLAGIKDGECEIIGKIHQNPELIK